MGKKNYSKSSIPVRQCANIKSKKHPDVQCKYSASDGEFCSRHNKNPNRFQETIPLKNSSSSKKQMQAASLIQKMWRTRVCFLRFNRQGPIVLCPDLSENQTDICTLESVSSIPLLYRWSYSDSKKHIWLFDIRSLSMMRSQDNKIQITNPYTREIIPTRAMESFLKRCTQLRNHKYCLLHVNEIDITPEQLWHQTMLDVSMKYDALGYHISLEWLDKMNISEAYTLYFELWDLWSYRLQLPRSLKHAVVPDWNKEECLLFKWVPSELQSRRDRMWWQKNIVTLLERMVLAKEKEHRTLGALYGMTAFALACPHVRAAYPWLVDV
jgi:hypothetical protein